MVPAPYPIIFSDFHLTEQGYVVNQHDKIGCKHFIIKIHIMKGFLCFRDNAVYRNYVEK